MYTVGVRSTLECLVKLRCSLNKPSDQGISYYISFSGVILHTEIVVPDYL